MENNSFTSNIDLLKLNGSFVRSIQGKNSKKVCLIIPIDDADLYQKIDESLNVKGVTLSLAHFIRKEQGKYGDTHLVKQSHSKAWNESHSEDEKKNEPIIGNSAPMQLKERIADVPSMEIPNNDLPF